MTTPLASAPKGMPASHAAAATFASLPPLSNGLRAPAVVSASASAAADALVDRSKFDQTLRLVALRVPVALCSAFLKRFAGTPFLFSRPRLKHMIDDPYAPPQGMPLVAAAPTAAVATATAAAAEVPAGDAKAATDSKDAKDSAKGKKEKKPKAPKANAKPRSTAPTRLLLLSEVAVPAPTAATTAPTAAPAAGGGAVEATALPFDSALSALPADLKAFAASHGATAVAHDLKLNYDYFSLEQVLRALLPPAVPVPTGFETVGHLAHLNLRADQLPYKHMIGRVYLDKLSPQVSTVINKVGTVSNEFRVFDMELIAGRPDFQCEVREHGCRFQFDFSRVYWNSRLQTEHTRIVALLTAPPRSHVLCDMFCGIGPFAIPAAKHGANGQAIVYANDLNPNSFHFLKHNAALNGVALSGPKQRLFPHNGDARAYIRALARMQMRAAAGATLPAAATATAPAPAGAAGAADELARRIDQISLPPTVPPPFHHITMNLPAAASTFCDVFRGLYYHPTTAQALPADSPVVSVACDTDAKRVFDFAVDAQAVAAVRSAGMPWIHCYYFSKAQEALWHTDGVQEIERVLQYRFAAHEQPRVHNVRLVAPAKMMLCISFQLPVALAFDTPPPVAYGDERPGGAPKPLPHHKVLEKAPAKPAPKGSATATGSGAVTGSGVSFAGAKRKEPAPSTDSKQPTASASASAPKASASNISFAAAPASNGHGTDSPSAAPSGAKKART